MKYDLQENLTKRHMTRREFLQFMVGSFLLLFGLGNFIAFLTQFKKGDDPMVQSTSMPASHGFGSRKFGA